MPVDALKSRISTFFQTENNNNHVNSEFSPHFFFDIAVEKFISRTSKKRI